MENQPRDHLVSALIRLCERVGGFEVVARETGLSKDNLWQVIKGIKLPSGNPRGVGPKLRAAISSTYPDWLTTDEGESRPSNHTRNIRFSVPAEDQAPIAQALQALDTHLKALAPVLQDSGREVLRKWATGAATVKEVADALEAMALASNTIENKKNLN